MSSGSWIRLTRLHARPGELISRTKRIFTRKPKDKNKLYALHATEVEYLSKGAWRQLKICARFLCGVDTRIRK
ncbi:hypothetical protein LMG29542_05257 [Paraburkholderia humisilvae]|uniref:Uncharacterized protein n=1 Tax=Paraburkholderia humisilvae TaxID=627669 RepID=A0A6J5EKB2_9BURK|nr:hypothetical protein LMG29542_05257 [Paraburkholderia humisilvae]